MRKVRVYVAAPLAVGAEVELPPFAAEHLVRVLRLPDGAAIACFNGDGHDYAARLRVHGKSRASVEVESASRIETESPLAITLVQSVARGEKMDLILQKATELGVARIVTIVSERTEVKLDEDRAGKRVVHWQRVVESACEQSGRAVVPVVEAPIALAHYVDRARAIAAPKLVLHPEGARAIGSFGASEVALAIGPEGGFSERDLSMLAQAGYESVRIGPRTLRTETAGLAAIAALQATAGDFR